MRKPHDHGDRWDAADVDHLLELLNDPQYTYAEIGVLLGRTGEAVRSKARRLGLR